MIVNSYTMKMVTVYVMQYVYIPSSGTADAVGGAASTSINNNNRMLPKIVKPKRVIKKCKYNDTRVPYVIY